MNKNYKNGVIAWLILLLNSYNCVQAQQVDATTMKYKVMAGYQGWFRTPGDAYGNRGWAHLFNGPVPSPQRLAFDTWPDMSELTKKEKYPAPGFTYADGSQAYLYSAQNYLTVLRHFQWMKQYGIDGVWLSEFCGHFPGGGAQADSTAVLNIMRNVRKAARATGRTWAFMWDMSGLSTRLSKQQVYDIIIGQWKKMVDEGVTADDRYLHENGKPVLLIWGFFPNRPASQPEYMSPVIDFLLAPGAYQATLIAGVDPNWRAQGTPEFQAMLMRMQGLQPWSVGRRVHDPVSGYDIQNTTLWAGDMEKCKANNVMFMPVFNSGTHIAGPPPAPPAGATVPRRMGNYLWEQFVKASQAGGINSAFVAMFDEINEGTQIMKIDLHPPVQAPFFTYDGATSDFYLRLVGAGAQLLRSGGHVPAEIPVSPFDPAKWYKIRYGFAGKWLTAGHAAEGPQLMDDQQQALDTQLWQITYDGRGNYQLMNKATGKYLSAGRGEPLTIVFQLNAKQSGSAGWHMEWGPAGTCAISSKKDNYALIAGQDDQVTLKKRSGADGLEWRIVPQP